MSLQLFEVTGTCSSKKNPTIFCDQVWNWDGDVKLASDIIIIKCIDISECFKTICLMQSWWLVWLTPDYYWLARGYAVFLHFQLKPITYHFFIWTDQLVAEIQYNYKICGWNTIPSDLILRVNQLNHFSFCILRCNQNRNI